MRVFSTNPCEMYGSSVLSESTIQQFSVLDNCQVFECIFWAGRLPMKNSAVYFFLFCPHM